MTEELDQVQSWDLWECSNVMKPLGWVAMANEQHMVVTSKKKKMFGHWKHYIHHSPKVVQDTHAVLERK